MILFKNSIKYNYKFLKQIRKYSFKRANISTLLYAHNPYSDVMTEQSNYFFNLETLIDFEDVVKYVPINKKSHYIIVQPDFEKLATAFGFEIKTQKMKTHENGITFSERIRHPEKYMENLYEGYRKRFNEFIIEFNKFLITRANVLHNFDYFNFENYDDNQNKEITKIIRCLQEINDFKEIELFDYKGSNKKRKYKTHLKYFYNYKQIKNELNELIKNKTEFFTNSKKLEETKNKRDEYLNNMLKNTKFAPSFSIANIELKRIEESIEFLNDSQYFSTHHLSKISIQLDKLIELENAVDKFVHKVLDDKLAIVKINKVKYKETKMR